MQPPFPQGKSDSMVSCFQDPKWSLFMFIAHQVYNIYIYVSVLEDSGTSPGCYSLLYAMATAWLHSRSLSMVVSMHKGHQMPRVGAEVWHNSSVTTTRIIACNSDQTCPIGPLPLCLALQKRNGDEAVSQEAGNAEKQSPRNTNLLAAFQSFRRREEGVKDPELCIQCSEWRTHWRSLQWGSRSNVLLQTLRWEYQAEKERSYLTALLWGRPEAAQMNKLPHTQLMERKKDIE